ncbi:hypothetical protein Tco_1361612 [Tanacetum coccineum]
MLVQPLLGDLHQQLYTIDVKSASTLVDLEKPLVKDGDADDVDVHIYRCMIGSLMYLTTSRLDIMFAVCACARFQVTPKTSHILAVKRIFRYLKGKPTLGLWYSRDSPFELCKKQTVVATSTTEAEYVVAASCCRQVKVSTAGMHVKRGRDTKKPQSSGPPKKVGDEAVHKELGNSMERAASSLEVEQDSGNINKTQSMATSNDPPLLRGYTLGSGEDSLKLLELMATCTKLCEMASIRRHLKLEDFEGIPSLPTAEIFEQLALMGYITTFDSLTFQKGHFSLQWKFFIHTILHCLSPKKTAWEQFSSNIATAIICLATHRTFNFSKFIFDAMAAPMLYKSPLHSVYALGHDKCSMQQHELMDLVTQLTNRIEVLEKHLQQTKKNYSTTLTRLILRVKTLENNVKTGKPRRRARIVISEDEDAADDSSK